MKRPRYRYVIYSPGQQGICDTIDPITDWKDLNEYTDKEFNELMKVDVGDWEEIKMEVKIVEKEDDR